MCKRQKKSMSKRKDSAKVADAYEKLYSELPEKVTGGREAQLHGGGAKEPREALVSLLKEHLPPSEQKEIEDELKKTASLQRTRYELRNIFEIVVLLLSTLSRVILRPPNWLNRQPHSSIGWQKRKSKSLSRSGDLPRST